MKPVIILFPFFLCLAGCSTARLHQPAYEAATTQIQQDFTALGKPGYFDEQRKTLLDGAAREESAVGNQLTAMRDAAVVDLVRPDVLTPDDNRLNLLKEAKKQLGLVYGREELDAESLDKLKFAPQSLARVNEHESILNTHLKQNIDEYLANFAADHAGDGSKPDPVNCKAVGEPTGARPEGATALSYEAIRVLCKKLKETTILQNELNEDVFANAKGQIAVVTSDINNRLADMIDSEATALEIQARIKLLTAALEKGKADQDDIKDFANELADAAPLVKQAGLEDLARILEDAAVAVLKPEEAVKESGSTRAQIAVALGLVDATQKLKNAYSAEPSTQRGNAALIGLAAAKHQLQMAKLDVARDTQQIAFLKAELAALLEQSRHLAATILILEKNPNAPQVSLANLRKSTVAFAFRQAASEALAAYAASWDNGAIPYHVLRFRAIQAERIALLDRAEMAESDYRSVIKPAIDELAAYGKSGISQANLLALLGHLGIAEAILESGE
jgi:hypothetical protein